MNFTDTRTNYKSKKFLRKCIFAAIVFCLRLANMLMFQIEPPSFFACQIWGLSSFKALSVTLGNVSSIESKVFWNVVT